MSQTSIRHNHSLLVPQTVDYPLVLESISYRSFDPIFLFLFHCVFYDLTLSKSLLYAIHQMATVYSPTTCFAPETGDLHTLHALC